MNGIALAGLGIGSGVAAIGGGMYAAAKPDDDGIGMLAMAGTTLGGAIGAGFGVFDEFGLEHATARQMRIFHGGLGVAAIAGSALLGYGTALTIGKMLD